MHSLILFFLRVPFFFAFFSWKFAKYIRGHKESFKLVIHNIYLFLIEKHNKQRHCIQSISKYKFCTASRHRKLVIVGLLFWFPCMLAMRNISPSAKDMVLFNCYMMKIFSAHSDLMKWLIKFPKNIHQMYLTKTMNMRPYYAVCALDLKYYMSYINFRHDTCIQFSSWSNSSRNFTITLFWK